LLVNDPRINDVSKNHTEFKGVPYKPEMVAFLRSKN